MSSIRSSLSCVVILFPFGAQDEFGSTVIIRCFASCCLETNILRVLTRNIFSRHDYISDPFFRPSPQVLPLANMCIEIPFPPFLRQSLFWCVRGKLVHAAGAAFIRDHRDTKKSLCGLSFFILNLQD